MLRRVFLSLMLITAAAPAAAAAQPPEPDQASRPAERRICRNVTQSTGSILGSRRVCRTETQERRNDERAREGSQRARDNDTARSSE